MQVHMYSVCTVHMYSVCIVHMYSVSTVHMYSVCTVHMYSTDFFGLFPSEWNVFQLTKLLWEEFIMLGEWKTYSPFLIQITCSRIRGCVKTCLTTWKRVLRSKVFFLSEHTCRPELQNCTRTCTTGTCKLRGEGKEVETSVCCTHCFLPSDSFKEVVHVRMCVHMHVHVHII